MNDYPWRTKVASIPDQRHRSLHGGRPHSLDVRRNSDVCLPEESHAFRVLFGVRRGNDAARARPHGKASGDVAGDAGPDAGFRSATPLDAAVFSRHWSLPMGREPAFSSAPARRSRLAGIGCGAPARPGRFCALDARYFRARCGIGAILPSTRHLLSDRSIAGRKPGSSRTSFAGLHAEPCGKSRGHSRIYGFGVLFVAAVGVDSAGVCGPGVFFFPSHARRGDFGRCADGNCRDGDPQSCSVVALLYYRITYVAGAGESYRLDVDHDFYQDLLNLGSSGETSGVESPRRYYDFPYSILPSCGRVLIIGAGTGNDVAAALRARCASVDAVEIDPAIATLGRKLHPEHPYDSSNVRIHITDGRAFFHQARAAGQRFDLIVFGLVDSQTALSVMSSLRLEFFLYSRESFEEALSLLDPQHGLFVVGFSVGWKDWVAQRICHTLELANGGEPLAVKASEYLGTVSFVAGPGLNQAAARLAEIPDVHSVGAELARVAAKPVRDDWPFLYQNPRSFPFVYLGSLVLVLIAGAYLVGGAVGRSDGAARNRLDWTMFFMGSAFLLVETKNLSQLSLLFGATWITNAVVFSSIFVMAIVANLIVERKSVPRLPFLFALLWAALLLSYFVPFSELTRLSPLGRGLIGGGVTALPVLFSSLIFAKMFQQTRDAANALGSNILGGLFGGALEAFSIFLGIKAMALLAIAVYGVAAFFHRRVTSVASPAPQVGTRAAEYSG